MRRTRFPARIIRSCRRKPRALALFRVAGIGKSLAGQVRYASRWFIKPAVSRFWIAGAICAVFGTAAARADGITLSLDGESWLSGAGAYGKGWGKVGEELRVHAGATIYVRYFATTGTAPRLYYAEHGTRWEAWKETGPLLSGRLGTIAASPVTLRVSDVGTQKSRATLLDGTGTQTWLALTRPGVYDLALHADAKWTRPPLTILEPEKRGLWGALIQALAPVDKPVIVPLPDSGQTGVLLVIALASLWVAKRVIRSRRARRHPSSSKVDGFTHTA